MFTPMAISHWGWPLLSHGRCSIGLCRINLFPVPSLRMKILRKGEKKKKDFLKVVPLPWGRSVTNFCVLTAGVTSFCFINVGNGVTPVAQQDWYLCSARMQVRFLAQHIGFKYLLLPQLWCRSQLWLGSDPWAGNSIYYREAKKEKENIKRKQTIWRA